MVRSHQHRLSVNGRCLSNLPRKCLSHRSETESPKQMNILNLHSDIQWFLISSLIIVFATDLIMSAGLLVIRLIITAGKAEEINHSWKLYQAILFPHSTIHIWRKIRSHIRWNFKKGGCNQSHKLLAMVFIVFICLNLNLLLVLRTAIDTCLHKKLFSGIFTPFGKTSFYLWLVMLQCIAHVKAVRSTKQNICHKCH